MIIAAAWFPPSVSGSSILSRNLWDAWPVPMDLRVVSFRPHGARSDESLSMPGIPIEWIEPWRFKDARKAAHLDPVAAFDVERRLVEVARRYNARGIWTNWPTTAFVLGAWRASRRLRLPLYVHLHDIWGEAFKSKHRYLESITAALFEGRVLRDAARVFTITQEARDYYWKRNHVDSYVLAHSIPDADLAAVSKASLELSPDGPGVLHYAGSIYRLMNQDAIVNLVKALPLCRRLVTLDCFTPNAPAVLTAVGIGGPLVRCLFAPKRTVMQAQRESAIIVLPLAFQSTNPREIQTVFPTKLLEYFICGRPILVHAPACSWAARSARANGWGYVVDQCDPGALASGIDTLMAHPELCQSLVAAAQREAQRRAASGIARALRAELQRVEADWKN